MFILFEIVGMKYEKIIGYLKSHKEFQQRGLYQQTKKRNARVGYLDLDIKLL